MVAVFREVRRVLRDDGCVWLNYGDGYSGGDRASYDTTTENRGHNRVAARAQVALPGGNQLLMHHRIALALQADGWVVRSTIVWAKKSPMPESLSGTRWVKCRVKVANGDNRPHPSGRTYCPPIGVAVRDKVQAQWSDCPGCARCLPNGGYVLRRGSWRCTTAHEYVFQLTKSMNYFSDGEAAKEEVGQPTRRQKTFRGGCYTNNATYDNSHDYTGHAPYSDGPPSLSGRNPRTVWTLSSEPWAGAHFATFPATLVYRCLLPSVSQRGCCPQCGAAWAPVVERGSLEKHGTNSYPTPFKGAGATGQNGNRAANLTHDGFIPSHAFASRVLSYRPTCE